MRGANSNGQAALLPQLGSFHVPQALERGSFAVGLLSLSDSGETSRQHLTHRLYIPWLPLSDPRGTVERQMN